MKPEHAEAKRPVLVGAPCPANYSGITAPVVLPLVIDAPGSRQVSTSANKRPQSSLLVRDHRYLDVRRILFRTVDSLNSLLIIGRLCFENVWHVFLRVAINDREPGALDLHHDAVAFLEHVIVGVEINRKGSDLIGDDGLEGMTESYGPEPHPVLDELVSVCVPDVTPRPSNEDARRFFRILIDALRIRVAPTWNDSTQSPL